MKTETHREKMAMCDEGRDWTDGSTNQRMLWITGKYQKLKDTRKEEFSSMGFRERVGPCLQLDFGYLGARNERQ